MRSAFPTLALNSNPTTSGITPLWTRTRRCSMKAGKHSRSVFRTSCCGRASGTMILYWRAAFAISWRRGLSIPRIIASSSVYQQIGRSFSDRADSTLGLVAVPLKDAARRYIERFASLRSGIFDESLPGVLADGSRFFFHVDNKSRYPDKTGSVFSTSDEARSHAFVIARELGQDQGWHGSFVVVTDDRGQEIARVQVGP
jgi:hypothetical protein